MRRPFLVASNKPLIIFLAITNAWLVTSQGLAETIWIEGENPTQSTMHRHPWWYDQVKKDAFSGGDFISNFDKDRVGEAEYEFTAQRPGVYELWVRANPIGSSMAYKLGNGRWTLIDLSKGAIDSENVAADGKPDLRFIAWFHVGTAELTHGKNTIRFRMDSKNSNHGYLDCFVLSNERFQPRGILKPDQIAAADKMIAEENRGWFVFKPHDEPPTAPSGQDEINLRWLNEKFAGEGGFIQTKGSRFVHSKTGEPVRFWAVNGPPSDLQNRASLDHCARLLAKYGVNLVRIHAGYFNESGDVDPAKVKHAIDVVESMKAEGIYSHFSVYFPLWLSPKPDNKWLKGYDGGKHPFAALYFDPDFQDQYRNWLKALLLTPSAATGKPLVTEPAVFGVELVNEDSYLFWTFATASIPEPELRIVERQFGDWLKQKYGSLEKAIAAWNGQREGRDNPAEGRMGFRPLWNMAHEKTTRDKDTVRFLMDSQTKFYRDTYAFLRRIGFKGLITASNWITADPQVLGPLEKYSYTVTDFIDRHGYFGCNMKGEAEWSVRDGYTYSDRSALKFDAEEPGKPRLFVHPVMDPSYDNKPSMISETTFNRPNRYRSEAPLYYAAYGALQGSDCIVHFALDGINWSVKPGYFMQPWTIATPAMMGQFPAAALIYRKGLVSEGRLMVDLNLKVDDILDLKGTPMPQDAALDDLRLKDLAQQAGPRVGQLIDPLVHYVGRTNVYFRDAPAPSNVAELGSYIDRKREQVTNSTGELTLNYGIGVLSINARGAQGISGALRDAGKIRLADVTISSDMPLGHVIAVSLDGEPLARSKHILLQVMSEEKPTDFRREQVGEGVNRIVSIGHDPWLVKEFSGTVRFNRLDAARLQVEALDHSGFSVARAGHADSIKLEPATLYYSIHP
jgi:hypothetical protein